MDDIGRYNAVLQKAVAAINEAHDPELFSGPSLSCTPGPVRYDGLLRLSKTERATLMTGPRQIYQKMKSWDLREEQEKASPFVLKMANAKPSTTVSVESIMRDKVMLERTIDLGAELQRAEHKADAAGASPKAIHNGDFTEVDWYGTKYHFAVGIQAKAVACLWHEFETTGMSLHQQTIGKAAGSAADENFRMDLHFRKHLALGPMIHNDGNGQYCLRPPEPTRKRRK